ncbi:16S rRNA (guanine(966)-N(2))-methyltransferase RsmD [Christensenellaceae bacterium OttesenSCG-928-M15]|nr:16S rRNA (guanine(966)-N(2))-methyltransferase RsmD [Christensenellaceae bacterium OttesenSCG-928-M15]
MWYRAAIPVVGCRLLEEIVRIIAGSCRGRVVRAPAGVLTRPTLARVKESLFGILQWKVPGARILDLYAGSGGLGMEALSRGAEHAVFNDRSKSCAALVRENLKTLGLDARATTLCMDAAAALEFLKEKGFSFDVAFLDPPYTEGAQGALEALFSLGLMNADGVVAVEHAWDQPPEEKQGALKCVDRRRYGDTAISFFRSDQTELVFQTCPKK